MKRIAGPMLLLLLLLPVVVSAGEGEGEGATPAALFQALQTEFNQIARGLYTSTTDAERRQVAERMAGLSPRVLALAERHPREPTAFDALVQVVTQELWLQNNTTFPGRSGDDPEARAFAQLQRDHLRSDRLGEATRRAMYGFSRHCETLLRAAQQQSPHREVRALACLRLAQFLHQRLQRLDLVRARPEVGARYRRLFGDGYMKGLLRQDSTKALNEIQALFERAGREYAEVKVPYEGTVAEKVRSELHAIRFLSVGKAAPEIRGEDQDATPFKLSDYRGKVVLLYFWSEY